MEAQPADREDHSSSPPQNVPEDPSAEVAETTAPVHFEGRGLDPEIERRHDRD